MMIEELIIKTAQWGSLLFVTWMIWRRNYIQKKKKQAETIPEPHKVLAQGQS